VRLLCLPACVCIIYIHVQVPSLCCGATSVAGRQAGLWWVRSLGGVSTAQCT
jgi:hypothetical protein